MSKIEWLARPGTIPASWSPIQDVIKGPSGRGYHCTKCSPGCDNCWAESMNKRFGNGLPFDGREAEFKVVESVMTAPYGWRKPRTVAVQLMGDLLHPSIPTLMQLQVLHVIHSLPQHTFLILTKRVEQLELWHHTLGWTAYPNLWLGVTVCNQEETSKIHKLLTIPAAVHFVSLEPMLSAIDLVKVPSGKEYYPLLDALQGIYYRIVVERPDYTGCSFDEDTYYATEPGDRPRLNFVIAGGESGAKARPSHPDWFRLVQAQCADNNVPFFFKQWGEWKPENQGGCFGEAHMWDDGSFSYKSGKKLAGHLLDGKEYHEWPIG